jgi:hypothetical protein
MTCRRQQVEGREGCMGRETTYHEDILVLAQGEFEGTLSTSWLTHSQQTALCCSHLSALVDNFAGGRVQHSLHVVADYF